MFTGIRTWLNHKWVFIKEEMSVSVFTWNTIRMASKISINVIRAARFPCIQYSCKEGTCKDLNVQRQSQEAGTSADEAQWAASYYKKQSSCLSSDRIFLLVSCDQNLMECTLLEEYC